jgi:enoyl-CoA hydratase/carnithine racemase
MGSAQAQAPFWRWRPTCAWAPRAASSRSCSRASLADDARQDRARAHVATGQGRASELLFTGRSASGEEGYAWGFYNRLCEPDAVLDEATRLAAELVAGPTFAHGITKKMLHQEWSMSIDEAIESEAQAQAICMSTHDFERAYRAFAAKTRPVFEGD